MYRQNVAMLSANLGIPVIEENVGQGANSDAASVGDRNEEGSASKLEVFEDDSEEPKTVNDPETGGQKED